MTAPERDEWRERLIEVASDATREMPFDWYCPERSFRLPRRECPACVAGVVADALLPVVRALADQRAAEELERAARLLCDLALDRDDGALEDEIAAIWGDAEKLRCPRR